MVFNPFRREKKPFTELRVPGDQIQLLGEPGGDGVAVLKAELAKILDAEGNTSRAYLSRVRYPGEDRMRAALILEGRAPEREMARAIGRACQPLVDIDILFLASLPSAAAEQLRQTVAPFYPPAPGENQLFAMEVQVGRGTNPEMPPNLAGAFVSVFVAARGPEDALQAAAAHLAAQGFEFLDLVDGKVDQLDPLGWDEFVETVWPELRSHFPGQEEVIAGLPYGRVFFGPFAGYEVEGA